jgi:hypothetical protein
MHPVVIFVAVRLKCTWNPGAPQLPDENVIVCKLLEPMIAHPDGLPSTVIVHTNENCAGLSGVVMVKLPELQLRLDGLRLPMLHGCEGITVIVVEHELVQPLALVTVTV